MNQQTLQKNGGVSGSMRILVADDDAGIRDVCHILLTEAGYSVDLKPNGNDLLADNFKVPDLFLIDKQLSGSDGIGICRQLKKNDRTKMIPLIIMSASPDIARIYAEAGADNYLAKPFDIEYLLQLVAGLMPSGGNTPSRRK